MKASVFQYDVDNLVAFSLVLENKLSNEVTSKALLELNEDFLSLKGAYYSVDDESGHICLNATESFNDLQAYEVNNIFTNLLEIKNMTLG